MDLKELLAKTASLSTIVNFCSGLLVCKKFMKKGSSNDVSVFPFVSGFLSCSLWLNYGYLVEDQSVLFVNIVGTFLMLAYAITHCCYTSRKSVIVKQLIVAVLLSLMIQLYGTRYESNKELAKTRVGMIACFITLLFFASPLTQLAKVIRTKSSECLPFPMILMSLVVTSQWALYGILIEDNFIVYPNIAGCVLSAFQLMLFVIYPQR